MINVEVDQRTLHDIEKRLGSLKSKTPTVLKDALNNTARWAQKKLANKAQETYTIKSAGFNKAMKISRASTNNLVAIIKTAGKQIALQRFTARKNAAGAKVKVVKANSIKSLHEDDRKAFIATFKSGHKAVAIRQGKSRLPVKEYKALSVPQMIGSEKRVYGIIKPDIKYILQREANKRIERLLRSS